MRSRLALILMTLGLLLGLTASPVAAAGLTVNTLADTAPADDGSCTLREAITAANDDAASGASPGECAAGAGADIITFSVAGTITQTSAMPSITTDIAISGGGLITVSGGDVARVFDISGTGTASLSGLTVTDGNTFTDFTFFGGAIHNAGTLTVTNSTISSSLAVFGGGIRNVGTATITNSTISGNDGANSGGGIDNDGGTLTVTNSTISGNTAGNVGAGILNNGTLTVTNSTISGNSTGNIGAGILTNGTATITNSTISGNTAGNQTGGLSADGTETLVNSIVAGNTPDDIGGGVETSTTNIIGNASVLDPAGLANNGGPTQTIALAQVAGNPAIDTAASAVCAAAPVNGVDQRGLPRPAACDIGAYEVQPTEPLPDAAMAQPAPAGPWSALGFGMLIISSLGVLAVANLGVVRRRRR